MSIRLRSSSASDPVTVPVQSDTRGQLPDSPTARADHALTHASSFGHTDVVEPLLRVGAGPGLRDNQGFTPRHWAAFGGHILERRTA